MMTTDEQQMLDGATEDAREFIRRAKELLLENDIFPGDHDPCSYDAHVIAIAKLISDRYHHRDINATITVYVGNALDDIRDTIERIHETSEP